MKDKAAMLRIGMELAKMPMIDIFSVCTLSLGPQCIARAQREGIPVEQVIDELVELMRMKLKAMATAVQGGLPDWAHKITCSICNEEFPVPEGEAPVMCPPCALGVELGQGKEPPEPK